MLRNGGLGHKESVKEETVYEKKCVDSCAQSSSSQEKRKPCWKTSILKFAKILLQINAFLFMKYRVWAKNKAPKIKGFRNSIEYELMMMPTLQRCTESEIFYSDSTPASAECTPTPLWLRNILKFWTPTPAQTPKWII